MPVPLRSDFDAAALGAIVRKSKDGPQARRLLALAVIYEGATRTEAARIGGVTLQVVRDWVVKFNAHGPEGLLDRKPPGQPSRLTDAHRAALATQLDEGGAVARSRMAGRGSLLGRQAMRTETGLATWSMRLSTSTPSATSPCWFARVRARSRGPIRAL